MSREPACETEDRRPLLKSRQTELILKLQHKYSKSFYNSKTSCLLNFECKFLRELKILHFLCFFSIQKFFRLHLSCEPARKTFCLVLSWLVLHQIFIRCLVSSCLIYILMKKSRLVWSCLVSCNSDLNIACELQIIRNIYLLFLLQKSMQ